MNTHRHRVRALAACALLLVACSAAAIQKAIQYISSGAAVVCPDLAVVPPGAQVCSAVAAAVEGFLTLWESTHPSMKLARAAGFNRVVRVGSYGFFPPAVANELSKPDVAAALDAYVAAALAKDGGAS